MAKNHQKEWESATNSSEYETFTKIKAGSYYADWISEKSQSFSTKWKKSGWKNDMYS